MRKERKLSLAIFTIEASVKLALTVPSSTMKKIVRSTWLKLIVKTKHVQKDIARFASSRRADMAALEKVTVNISMKTQNQIKVT